MKIQIERSGPLTCIDVKVWFFDEISPREAGGILEQQLGSDERIHSFSVGPQPTPLQRLRNLEQQLLEFAKSSYTNEDWQRFFRITARQVKGIREDLESAPA